MTIAKPIHFKPIPIAALVVIVAICSWLPFLDNIASEQIDAGMTRSLASFATGRVLNATISAAQGTETAIQPAGVGIVLTPGEVLDPINDLVESFSNLMLLASVAFGIQKILIEIGAYPVIPAMVSLLAALWIYLHIREKPVAPVLSRALVILLVIRFAVPAMTVGSDWLFRHFLANTYETSQNALDRSSEGLPEVDTQINQVELQALPSADADANWYAKWMPSGFSLPKITLPDSPVAKLQQRVAEWVSRIIDIMVVFVLQVVLLPLLILWVLYSLVRRLVE